MLYKIVDWPIDGMDGYSMEAAVNLAGDYIGDEETAKQICDELGIAPEVASEKHSVCSIGFCEGEQKWFGWSHRAMFGFGVGSTVKFGDCGYVPKGWDDFLLSVKDFWKDEYHLSTTATRAVDNEGRPCANVVWIYSDDVPNASLRGTQGGTFSYPPEEWGKGEWTAQTLEDAKQMAIDFADSVS